MKKSIIESYMGMVMFILMAGISIFFIILAVSQLLNCNPEDDDGVIFALFLLSGMTVLYIILAFACTNVISYNYDTQEFVLKPMLFGRTRCIKKADILDVHVYYVAMGAMISPVIALSAVPFDCLTEDELRSRCSDRAIFFLYRKKLIGFIKSFWDGEIKRRA